MVAITWAKPVAPRIESGVDRGVLFVEGLAGVPWNGLISVDETFSGGERESFRFDGIKHLELINARTFGATINAFSAPREFGPCEGNVHFAPGMIITRQPRTQFDFSYRSKSDTEDGYKLHLIYNASATPRSRGYATQSNQTSPTVLSWVLNVVPKAFVMPNAPDNFEPGQPAQGMNAVTETRPTAHFILDSAGMDPEILSVIESYLYGTEFSEPVMPTLEMIVDLIVVNDVRRLVPVANTIPNLASSGYSEFDLAQSSLSGVFFGLATNRLYQSDLDPAGLYRLEA